jgi:hypothetical protein
MNMPCTTLEKPPRHTLKITGRPSRLTPRTVKAEADPPPGFLLASGSWTPEKVAEELIEEKVFLRSVPNSDATNAGRLGS